MADVRASRLFTMVLLLQARRTMTAAELAGEVGVSERTVYRDITALAAAGVPVYAEQGRHGGYRLVDGYRTRLTGLSRVEAEALFLLGLYGPARDMGLGDVLATAQLKVSAALQDEVTRTVQFYGVVLKAGIWYLVARVGADLRVYRVDRVVAVEVTDQRFVREESFDLPALWAERAAQFVRGMLAEQVTVRLSQAGLRALRFAVEPPAVQAATDAAGEPDAQGWVVTHLPVESAEVAYDQLLRLGPEVEVLAPQPLRDQMRVAAQRLARLYQR